MKKTLLMALSLSLLAPSFAMQSSAARAWREMDFETPPMEERMRLLNYGFKDVESVDSFIDKGFGGIVSNVLFEKDYLDNEKQFELISEVYDYAKSIGLNTWIYDEYQWPSGKAFGKVLEGHDELEAVGIRHITSRGNASKAPKYEVSEKKREIRVMDAYITVGGERIKLEISADGKSASAKEPPEGNWNMDVYVLEYPYKGEEVKGEFQTLRPVNLLIPETTERFIDITYQRYKDRMGESFGNVEAFFTDEPQLGNRDEQKFIVWCDGLEVLFYEKYGYDLPIPSLFDGNSAEDRLARIHYYRLVAELWRVNYSEALSAWCKANGTEASGHFLFEENMNDHIETYGGDFMQLVGAMDIPGLDVLHTNPASLLTSTTNIGNYMGALYTSSAAKNAGKDKVMVEYNPASGEKLTSETKMDVSYGGLGLLRLLGSTEYVMINPHKSYTNSQYTAINEYIGRLNTVLHGLVENSDVAVFYPIATVQAYHNADVVHSSTGGSSTSKAVSIERSFSAMSKEILTRGGSFTFLDDESISGAVLDGGKLKVGLGEYSTVVLAYAEYISPAAAEKLAEFESAGGHVIFVGTKPEHATTEAEDDGRIGEIFGKMGGESEYKTANDKFYADILSHDEKRIEKLADDTKKTVLLGEFVGEGKTVTYVFNSLAKENEVVLAYTDGAAHSFGLYDPENGTVTACETDGDGKLTLTLGGYRTLLLVTDERAEAEANTDTETDTDTDTEAATATAKATDTAVDTESAEATDTTDATESTDTTEAVGEGGGDEGGKSSVIPAVIAAAVVAAVGAVAVIFAKRKKK